MNIPLLYGYNQCQRLDSVVHYLFPDAQLSSNLAIWRSRRVDHYKLGTYFLKGLCWIPKINGDYQITLTIVKLHRLTFLGGAWTQLPG